MFGVGSEGIPCVLCSAWHTKCALGAPHTFRALWDDCGVKALSVRRPCCTGFALRCHPAGHDDVLQIANVIVDTKI